MAGGGGGGTQTTEPPKWQQPYIKHGLEEASGQYSRDQGTYSPYSGYAGDALRGMVTQAQNNPITGAAGDLATKTLNGGFLGSNPYLDQTFNQAALATQNQLASQFAGSGRNVGASQGLRAQQLGDLATNIYGGAYDAERNRQNQVLGMSPQLQQSQYGDLDRLLGIGQMQGNSLDQYMGRVTGNVGSTTKQGGGGNTTGNVVGGAMLGAQLGSVVPGVGTLIGGGLGALGGWLSDARTKTDVEKVGEKDGLNVYEYRYKHDPTGARHVGHMAQEVEKKYPDAVSEDKNGTKYVMYDRVAKHGILGLS